MGSPRYLAQQSHDFLVKHHGTLIKEISSAEKASASGTLEHGVAAMETLFSQYLALADIILQSDKFTADEKQKFILPNLRKISSNLQLDKKLVKRASHTAKYFNCKSETLYLLAQENYFPAICDLFVKHSKSFSISVFEVISISDEGCYWAAKLLLLAVEREKMRADDFYRFEGQIKKAREFFSDRYVGVGVWYKKLVKEFRDHSLLSVNDPDAFILQAAAGKLIQEGFGKAHQDLYGCIVKTINTVLSRNKIVDAPQTVINQKLNMKLQFKILRIITKATAEEEKTEVFYLSTRPAVVPYYSVYASDDLHPSLLNLDALFAGDEEDIQLPPPIVREEPIEIFDYDPVKLVMRR